MKELEQFRTSTANLLRKQRADLRNFVAQAMFWVPLSVFDKQADFNHYILEWNNMYMLFPGPSGTLSVVERSTVSTQLDIFFNIIKFRVFFHEYSSEYAVTLENME